MTTMENEYEKLLKELEKEIEYEKQVKERYEKQKAEQKASSDGLATITFLITAAYLFIAGPGLKAVFSLKGVAFVFIGMFAAALIIGILFYFLQRGIAMVLMRLLSNSFTGDPFTPSIAISIKLIGYLLMALQIAATVWLTTIAFHLLFK